MQSKQFSSSRRRAAAYGAAVALLISGRFASAEGACAAFAEQRFEYARLGDVLPTQMEIGEEYVDEKADRWRRAARRSGRTLEEWLRERLDREAPTEAISPSGRRYFLDGHHSAAAVRELLGRRRAREFVSRFRIAYDFRAPKADGSKWTDDEFIVALLTPRSEGGLGKGQFIKRVRSLPPLERFRYLPLEIDDFGNNRMRSLVGAAFRLIGLDGSMFEDYAEFDLGEMIERRHFEWRDDLPDLKYKDRRIESVARWIAGDDPVVRGFLLERLRDPALRPEVESALRDYDAR